MTNFNRYHVINEDGKDAVMCDWRGDGHSTYVFRPEQMPVRSWEIANAMNIAFKMGYEAAQQDVRSVIGIKP